MLGNGQRILGQQVIQVAVVDLHAPVTPTVVGRYLTQGGLIQPGHDDRAVFVLEEPAARQRQRRAGRGADAHDGQANGVIGQRGAQGRAIPAIDAVREQQDPPLANTGRA